MIEVSPEKLSAAMAQAKEFLRKQSEVSPEVLARMTDEQKQWMAFRQRVADENITSQERERICAWHESGHALAELKYGVGRVVQISIKPNECGYCWTKIGQEKLFPLTDDTIKRIFLCSLAGPFAEMYLTGQGDDSADHEVLYAFCKQHGLTDEQIRHWELWTCRRHRDNDPVPGVNWFIEDNLQTILRVACVLFDQKTLTGQEVKALLWKN